MRKTFVFASFLCVSIFFGEQSYAQFACKYVKAISGDTISAVCEGEDTIIRLYGIDAPDIGQIEHDKSAKFLENIMKKQRTYIIGHIIGKNKNDKYGRINALVYKDGECVNKSMVEAGMAFVYEGSCNIDKCAEWRELENTVKSRKDTIWFIGADEKPWEYREKNKHLAGKDQGYFEDIFYVKEDAKIVAYDTAIPDDKIYAPPPPSVVYVPYPTNSTTIYNVNQNQVNVKR